MLATAALTFPCSKRTAPSSRSGTSSWIIRYWSVLILTLGGYNEGVARNHCLRRPRGHHRGTIVAHQRHIIMAGDDHQGGLVIGRFIYHALHLLDKHPHVALVIACSRTFDVLSLNICFARTTRCSMPPLNDTEGHYTMVVPGSSVCGILSHLRTTAYVPAFHGGTPVGYPESDDSKHSHLT